MRTLLALFALTVTACATTTQARVSLEAESSPRPVRELHHLATGALPPMVLREVALGATLDSIVRGSSPSGSGQILCATGSGTATFQTPASCGLATGTNYWTLSTRELDGAGGQLKLTDTTDETRFIGWTSYPATSTNLLRYRFGDNGTGLQSGSNDQLELFSYHGILLAGGRASTSAPAAVTGSGSSDYSVEIAASTGGALQVDGATRLGSTGTNIAASYAGSFTTAISPSTVPANSTVCGSLPAGSVTITGTGANKPCFVGAPSGNSTLVPWCKTTANTFTLCLTNPTTSAVAPPGNVPFAMRDLE